MAIHKHTWFGDLWQHIPAAITEFPLLTAGEQTKLSWAKPIETPNEAPAAYVDGLIELTDRLGVFPRTILTPSYAGFLTRTTEKLVCCHGEEIYIFERVGSEVRRVVYTQAAIDLMEFGSILLKAWLKVVGADGSGRHVATTIRFNAVTDFLFLPILDQWRRGRDSRGAAPLAAEQAKFDHLTQTHYKFMNIAKRVLLPGDRVLASVMQPELRTPVIGLFGHTYTRLEAPAHIVVLTDRELIVAAEESQRGWREESKYGSISTYIPLRKISAVIQQQLPDGCRQLLINLPADEQIQLDFAAAQTADVERLLAQLPEHQDCRNWAG